MRKQIFKALSVMVGCAALVFTSCSDDDKKTTSSTSNVSEILAQIDAADQLEYNSSNATNWQAYMKQIANLLQTDADKLYSEWSVSYNGGSTSYAEEFKNAGVSSSVFTSARQATLQILSGCSDIANEVGEAKIGDPVNLWNSGKYEEAVYAVESWFSYHSRADYSNNIVSIRNSYLGSRDGSVGSNSLSSVIATSNAELDTRIKNAIQNAIDAILAIPQPFRSHLFSAEATEAIVACSDLKELIDGDLTNAVNAMDESTCKNINAAYVDNVVLPTYLDLKNANAELRAAVYAFNGTSFDAVANAWVAAREPWERSEAFLFGPVDELGLDPNMDSWPLDRNSINGILASGDFSGLVWDDSDSEEEQEAAQSIRGFHTLEYLVFKQGNPRTVN